ncbi:MAG: sulfatase [Spirochaetaceae bacterium]|nr:sulfatase [Spirochaetaceae bacterium]
MAASDHPNIIVLITDTFRRDNLGSRAARPVRTPALDRFADDRATELTGLTMGSFPTIPHRTDFASGRAGWPHYGWQPISHSTGNHIATLLTEQGYFTQLICDTPHLFKAGLQVGFHGSYQHRGQEGDLTLLHMNDPVGPAMPRAKTRRLPETFGGSLVDLHEWTNAIRTEADTFCARTAATTATWLERNYRAGPFFLWVDFFDPHEPWDPPEYLVRRYDPDYDGPPMLHPNYGPADHYTPAELRNLWSHYAAEAELVDRHIGRVLAKVDDLDLWRNSLVVVMADHGMAIGEHGCCGKSSHVDEDARFWPLYPVLSDELCLIAGRAQAGPVPAGARLDLLAQPFDLLPTLCELAGVEIAPPEPLHGRSFAAEVLAGSGSLRDHVITAAHIRPAAETPDLIPARASTPFLRARTPLPGGGTWGYAPVGPSGAPQLFDLAADPRAERDVAEANRGTVAEMHELLLASLEEYGAGDAVQALWRSPGSGAAGGSWARDYLER